MKIFSHFAFAIVLLMVFIGCGSSLRTGMYHYTHLPASSGSTQIFPVYLDKNFGEADKVSVREALEQWNYAFNGHARFVIVDDRFDMGISQLQKAVRDNAFLILKIDSKNPLVADADYNVKHEPGGIPVAGVAAAFTPQIGSHKVYVIRDRIKDNEDVKYLVMHELGHSLGAAHTEDGLMFPIYSKAQFQCVDWLAVKQVASYQHWNVSDMNYCVLDHR